MEKILEQARKFLEDNPGITKVELSDAQIKVTVIRNSPFYWYCYQYPCSGYHWQPDSEYTASYPQYP